MVLFKQNYKLCSFFAHNASYVKHKICHSAMWTYSKLLKRCYITIKNMFRLALQINGLHILQIRLILKMLRTFVYRNFCYWPNGDQQVIQFYLSKIMTSISNLEHLKPKSELQMMAVKIYLMVSVIGYMKVR